MKLKKTIVLTASFILLFHFTLTFIFNSPYRLPHLNKYMTPLFDQNWRFFAPDPPNESRTLYFRYQEDKSDDWSKWINPGKIAQNKFDYNRFSYNGKLVHLNASVCYYLNIETINFLNSTKNLNESEKYTVVHLDKKISQAESVDLVKSYLKNWVAWKSEHKIKKMQIVLEVKNTYTSHKEYKLFPTIRYN